MQLKESIFNKAAGISICEVKHKGKIYRGVAHLHPDDEKDGLASKYTGCRYAELRAEIKALKDEYKKEKAACEECRKFVKACSQYKNFDKESPTAKAIFRQLNRRIKKVNELVDLINKKLSDLDMAIRQKDIVHKALERKHSSK